MRTAGWGLAVLRSGRTDTAAHYAKARKLHTGHTRQLASRTRT